MSMVRKESNCHRKKRPRPTTSGKMVLAVISISSVKPVRKMLRLDQEVEGSLGAEWYLPPDLSSNGPIRLCRPRETSEVRAVWKPPSDFCLYNMGLYELGIDPAEVLPPMKPT